MYEKKFQKKLSWGSNFADSQTDTMIDYLIFGTFLTANLAIGLYHGRNVKTLKDYALGTKCFSTIVLVATISATWISGSSLANTLCSVHKSNLLYILANIALPFQLLLIGSFLAKRFGEFLGHLTVGEMIGSIYGREMRILTSLVGILRAVSFITAQFKASAEVLSLFFDLDNDVATLLSAAVIVTYTTFGGIDSVNLTDMIQFLILNVFVPVLVVIVWMNIKIPTGEIMQRLDEYKFFSLQGNKDTPGLFSWSWLLKLLFFGLPGLGPSMVHRVLLSKDVKQAKRAFIYSFFVILGIKLLYYTIGVLIFVEYPDANPYKLLSVCVAKCNAYVGMKGLAVAGIIAMVMSSADTYINSSAVSFAHDIIGDVVTGSNRLLIARIFSGVFSTVALLLALKVKTPWGAFAFSYWIFGGFYMPMVTTPLLLAILGFRSSKRSALMGVIAGFITVASFKYTGTKMSSLAPGMLANLVTMLATHYLLGEPGGWVGIKVKAPLVAERQAGVRRWENVKAKISRFDLYTYLTQQLPSNEGIYTLIGLWVLGPVFFAHITLPKQHHIFRYLYQYPLLTLNTLLLTYPIWFAEIKSKCFMAFFYPFTLCYALCVAPAMLWIVSGHAPAYATLFLGNLCLAALLLPWPVVVGMAWVGPVVASLMLNYTCPEAIASVAYSVPYLQLICGLGVLAALCYYTTHAQTEKTNYHTLAHHYNTITKAMHKLRTIPERFMQQLQDKTHGLDTAVEMSKALQEALKQSKDKQDTKALTKAAIQLTTHIKDSSGYLSKLLTLVQNGGLLQRKTMALRDFTHQLLNAIARNPQLTTELIIANQSSCKQINWDIEKIQHLLLEGHKQLQNKHPNTDYFFLHIQDTKLTYPNYPDGLPAIAFTLTTEEAAPELEAAYLPPDKAARLTTTPYQSQAQQCIYAHYGYFNMQNSPKAYLFVLPTSLKKIRPESITDTPVQTFSPAMLRKAKAMETDFWAAVTKKEYDMPTLEKAVAFMKEAHAHQQRKSGEPYYTHPLTVAQYASQHSDSQDVLIASLLHDTIEDTDVTPEALKLNFGQRVSTLVQHLSHIQNAFKKYKLSDAQTHAKLEKVSGDKEAVLIKLCDRLHNMRTLGAMPKAKRLPKAQETLNVYIPMAKKVGYTNLAKELTRLCKAVF